MFIKDENKRKGINMKILFSIIALVFMLSSSTANAQSINNIREMVSEANGTIRDSYFVGGDSGIVVHIQDLHCNYDAQISVYNIINELIDKYDLDLVSIEGSVGQLETAPYSKRPNDDIKESVARYFVRTGELDGAGLAHMMKHSGFSFFGADDAKLHQENVDAYMESLKGQVDNERYYNNIKEILEKLKSKAYSKELLDLDKNIQAYKAEDLDFVSYISYINEFVLRHGFKKKDYSNFIQLTEVFEKESNIDFLEVDTQRSEYIDFLGDKLDKKSLSELLDKSLFFKTGKISALEFYGFLEDVSMRDQAFNMSEDYLSLARYIEYIKQYSKIDNITLFIEIDTIEKILKDKLFTDKTQREIDRLSYTLDVLRDLFALKLTKETLQYYRDNRKEFTPAYIINFISDAAKKYNVKYKLDPSFRKIAAKLPDMERFYKLAQERDSILVYNTLNQMKKKNTDIAVLVSGGFHTDGITKLLKEKQVSYIVVTPKVEKLYLDNPYKSVLLGEETEFDKFIKKAKENTRIYKQNTQKEI